jgi:inner membrane protein
LWLGVLVLLLQIPLLMIREVVNERQNRKAEALLEVASKWGQEQKLVGPVLEVPYEVERFAEVDGKQKTTTEVAYAFFLPDELQLTADVDSELRYRGIFEVPLHTSQLKLTGNFGAPDFGRLGETPTKVLWERAKLNLYVSDTKGIAEASALAWSSYVLTFGPGTSSNLSGISAPIGAHAQSASNFSFSLRVRGAEGIYFAPVGANTRATLSADWPHPSFQGSWLPTARQVTAGGFTAEYSIPHLARDYPTAWNSASAALESNPNLSKAQTLLFGLSLEPSVDPYRMAERSAKYSILFLLLTFGSLWLFEVLGKQRIHSLQYLLIGAGMCLFFLLELALSEHIGFALAYTCASGMITLLISGYCVAVLKERRRAAVIGSAIASLYGGMYVLLGNEDFALLVGSLELFSALGVLMFLTRRIDWYASPLAESPGASAGPRP